MPGRQSSKFENKSQQPQQAPRPHSPLGPIMCSSNIPSYTKPAQPQTQPVQSPGFFSSVKEGIALGVGSSIGNRIVSGFFGPPSVEIKAGQVQPAPAAQPPNAKCDPQQISFDTCIKERRPIAECETHLSLLNKCLSEN